MSEMDIAGGSFSMIRHIRWRAIFVIIIANLAYELSKMI
jgi:hypothetical protein